jgi:lipopolysaccharide export system protein LptA
MKTMAVFFLRRCFPIAVILALAVLMVARGQKREFIVKHADRFLYERANRITRLLGNVEIEHEGFTLTSRAATYREDSEVIEFDGDVRAVEPGRMLTARRLVYRVPDSLVVATGEVVLLDEERSITIQSDSLRHHRPERVYHLTGNPVFRKTDKQDLRISCRTMEYQADDKVADFISDVIIEADSLTILCQRGRYYDRDNRLIIEGEPIAFESNNIMVGRHMEVRLVEEEIRWIRVIDDAEGLYLESGASAEEPSGQSWVKGDTLMMFLTDSRISRMRVLGNAESFYRPGAGDSSQAINRAIGNEIILDFEEGEIERVFVKEHTEGTYQQVGPSKPKPESEAEP